MTILNVLFWNINRKNLTNLIEYYVFKYNVDVLVLIEDAISSNDMLISLNKNSSKYFFCKSNNRKISIYTSFDSKLFKHHVTDSEFVSLVEFNFIDKSILFGALHLPSKLTATTSEKRSFTVRNILREIDKVEGQLGCSDTILVGDFNMNPFEDGMVQPDCFNAAMCRTIASANTRSVNGSGMGKSIDYKYFYNPRWSFMGDLSKYTPGTYYFYGNDYENHYRWNMLDQILIRPSLIGNLVESSLEIIDKDINGVSLINETNKTRVSSQQCDHLPVFFTMNL